MNIRRFAGTCFCAALILVSAVAGPVSCNAYRGYGVLVWKNESLPVSVGEEVNIASIFSVDDYYEVDYKGSLVQIPMWQVQFFNTADEAKKYQAEFLPYKNLYVFTLKTEGLPIRSAPETTATVIYKLKSGKVAKVIGRDEEPTQIEQYHSYWYWVLTEEGYRGYVYGYYLKTIESASPRDERLAKVIEADPTLDRFLKSVWIPAKTADMLSSGRIDVTYLEKKYALTPKPDEKAITLTNEDMNKDFFYTEIKKITGDTYEFTGTDLKVQIFPSDKIYVSYLLNGAYATREFDLAPSDIGEAITKAAERSQNILSKFLNRGATLQSSSYGTITLGEDYRFAWSNLGALKSILPPAGEGKGKINFNKYLGRQATATAGPLAGPFEGAVSFVFDGFPDFGVTFIYTFSEAGVRLVYVARENIYDNEIRRIGSSPLVLFFNFVK
ncbi:MAG: SH3 domain-containing protein [Spirochaetales bacterium]|nr:SH3 domain-containing protein [Spirochaetales bacterium]